MNADNRQDIIDTLHREGCSCVIAKGDSVTRCHRRGVADLLHLLKTSPETLSDSFIADKVVGKGAAALMALGGVGEVYADVISRPALALLDESGIHVSYGESVEHIINRSGTGVCPVETLCQECATPQECLPLVEQFVERMQKQQNN